MGDGLRLDRRIDDRRGEVDRLGRSGAHRRGKTFLKQGVQFLLTHPLTPARHHRTVERQVVTEEFLAAEQLIIRIFHPPFAQGLIRQVMH